MFVVKYSFKDLYIQRRGNTLEEALEKVKLELACFNAMFPWKYYPKTPRKYTVRIEE